MSGALHYRRVLSQWSSDERVEAVSVLARGDQVKSAEVYPI